MSAKKYLEKTKGRRATKETVRAVKGEMSSDEELELTGGHRDPKDGPQFDDVDMKGNQQEHHEAGSVYAPENVHLATAYDNALVDLEFRLPEKADLTKNPQDENTPTARVLKKYNIEMEELLLWRERKKEIRQQGLKQETLPDYVREEQRREEQEDEELLGAGETDQKLVPSILPGASTAPESAQVRGARRAAWPHRDPPPVVELFFSYSMMLVF